jgi:hypothetical protein
MKRISNKKLAMIIAIFMLVVLNIWRWWPATTRPHSNNAAESGTFSLESFELKTSSADSIVPFKRDIFYPKKVVVFKPVTKKQLISQPVLPIKSPEELARDLAQVALGQIKCVGISVREKKVQAYLLNQSDTFLVSVGDRVGGRFVVEKIMTDRVLLLDPDTGVEGQIVLSGK